MSKINTEKRLDNHYIPKFYLDNFISDDGSINEYLIQEKQWKDTQLNGNSRITPKGAGKTKGIYIHYDKNQEDFNDDREVNFSYLESNWAKLVDKVILNENNNMILDAFLEDNEYNSWLDFVAFSSIRTNPIFSKFKQIQNNIKLATLEVFENKRNVNFDMDLTHKEILKTIFPSNVLEESPYFKFKRNVFSKFKFLKLSFELDFNLFPIGDSFIVYNAINDFYLLPLTPKSVILISEEPESKLKELKKSYRNEEGLLINFAKIIIDNAEFSLFCADKDELIDRWAKEIHLNNNCEPYKVDLSLIKKEEEKKQLPRDKLVETLGVPTYLIYELEVHLKNMVFKNNLANYNRILPYYFFSNNLSIKNYIQKIATKEEKYDILNDCYSIFWIVPSISMGKFRKYLLNLLVKNKLKDGSLDVIIIWDSLTTDSFLVAYISKRKYFIFSENQSEFIRKFKLVQIGVYSKKDEDLLENEKVKSFLSWEKNSLKNNTESVDKK